MSAMVARHRIPEIVGPVGIFAAIVLLRVIAGARQLMVKEAGDEFVANNRLHGGVAHVVLAPRVMSSMVDGARRYFRLEDGRYGLRLARKATLDLRDAA